MAEGKKSFVIYCDLISVVEKLSDDDAGKLMKHLLRYVNDMNPEPPNTVIDLVFEPIRLQLKRDLVEWVDTCEKRKIAGSKGGIKSGESRRKKQTKQELQKRSKTKQNEANEADTVNVTVTDTVTETKEEKDMNLIFETFRQLYPGTKRGHETEFKTLQKHDDWKEVVYLLPEAIERQIAQKKHDLQQNKFVPPWKNLKTWLNNRCWEEETPNAKPETTPATNDSW